MPGWLRRSLVVIIVTAGMVALAFGSIGQWRDHRSMESGARLLSSGEYASAIRALLPVVARTPSNARAHYYLGLAYSGKGLSEGAVNQFKEAILLAPDEAQFHEGLGQAYREAGDFVPALSEFEEAIRRDPHEPRYQVDLASLLLDQGRVPEAITQLRRTVEIRPDSAQLHLFLAETLRRAGDRDGMVREYCQVIRLGKPTALRELARQELREEEVMELKCQ